MGSKEFAGFAFMMVIMMAMLGAIFMVDGSRTPVKTMEESDNSSEKYYPNPSWPDSTANKYGFFDPHTYVVQSDPVTFLSDEDTIVMITIVPLEKIKNGIPLSQPREHVLKSPVDLKRGDVVIRETNGLRKVGNISITLEGNEIK